MRKYFKKFLPSEEKIARDSGSRVKKYMLNPVVWRVNKHAISKGAAIGGFIAFLPLPMQMLIAAIMAIVCRANLPIAVVLTWITNPFTFLPINYFIYKIGGFFVGNNQPPAIHHFQWNGQTLSGLLLQCTAWLKAFGKPFLLGLPIVAVSTSILLYFLVRILWRLSVYYAIRKRNKRKG